MLAVEQNLKLHLENLKQYPSPSSVTGIPKVVAATQGSNRVFTGNFEDSPFFRDVYGGETEPDMFGAIRNFNHIGSIDYFKLRLLSRQLFTENMYAASIIGRLVTNIIHEGLDLEADPSKTVTGFEDDAHIEWTSNVEELFSLWSEDKSVDIEENHNLSTLQKVAYTEALIEGDILKVINFDKKTGLPRIRLIPGRHVQSAPNSASLAQGNNKIIHGVEIDSQGRHVAYHVLKDRDLGVLLEAERIPAKGRTSNRDTARLIYHSPPPQGRTRGFPLLYRILQPLSQIGRYATYELKAAEINAALAMWVEKGEEREGSNPLGGPTLRSEEVTTEEEAAKADLPRQRMQGGTMINELQFGEKPHSFTTTRPNVNFPAFKKSILQDIAAALEIPPEILALMFENSFSASRQATIEFKAYVRKEQKFFSTQFNKDIYGQWLLGMVLNNKIKAEGYVNAFKGGDIFGIQGWKKSRFPGYIKQNVDILKEAKAYKEYIDEGLIDRDVAAQELTGADYMTVVKRLKKQNILLAEARDPLLGEINTSVSRVESEAENTERQEARSEPKRPKERTEAIAISALRNLDSSSRAAVMNIFKEDLDFQNLGAVDSDVDEMDLQDREEQLKKDQRKLDDEKKAAETEKKSAEEN